MPSSTQKKIAAARQRPWKSRGFSTLVYRRPKDSFASECPNENDPVTNALKRYGFEVVEVLLRDRTTGKNIIWADGEYAQLGKGYTAYDEMTLDKIRDGGKIKPRVAKAADQQAWRTKEKAEVFTPSWLCEKMVDSLDDAFFGKELSVFEADAETGLSGDRIVALGVNDRWKEYVDNRLLEITCGEAPFICSPYDATTGDVVPVNERIGFLDRKLRVVGHFAKDRDEWLEWAMRAVESSYGYEYQGDNLLIARINVLNTVADYMDSVWNEPFYMREALRFADVISWNLWQMDGLRGCVPSEWDLPPKATEADAQLSFFDMGFFEEEAIEEDNLQAQMRFADKCTIYDWRADAVLQYESLNEGIGAGMKKKFYGIIGNPPYQETVAKKSPTNNGQKRVKSIFNSFQDEADKVAAGSVVLVYPGGRWIHQSGKGMQEFGKRQINDQKLAHVVFFRDANEVFDGVGIADGISIVLKKMTKENPGFKYTYIDHGTVIEAELDNPGDDILPLDPRDSVILQKLDAGVKSNGLKYLHDAILPQKLFRIESSFVEDNPDIVRKYMDGDYFDPATEVKLFANDKAGKAGRAMWFVVPASAIPFNLQYVSEWQVVVSSANAGGQKRDNQIAIIDNHSAFGRARVALRSFRTSKEAENFFAYANSNIIRYAFLMTDESLTSLGKRVPDFVDYSDGGMLDFDVDIDMQLQSLFKLTKDEIKYIEGCVSGVRAGAKEMS